MSVLNRGNRYTSCFVNTLRKKKILLIDDAEDVQALISLVLESKYSIQCTSDGEKALTLLKTTNFKPDLILLDTQMPVMDGFVFRKRQIQDMQLNKIPVIVTTGDKNLNVDLKMLSPWTILYKPISIDTLLRAISCCLEEEEAPYSTTNHL